jgi:hypothetical protein
MDDLCALNGDRTPEFMPTRMIGVAPGPAPDLRGDVVDP